jgi:hypothetical protein
LRERRALPPALRRHEPHQEEQEYIDAIEADIRWLGFDWDEVFHQVVPAGRAVTS